MVIVFLHRILSVLGFHVVSDPSLKVVVGRRTTLAGKFVRLVEIAVPLRAIEQRSGSDLHGEEDSHDHFG
jgi:hypothetical protein